MNRHRWAIGVDLGGTKVEVAAVKEEGEIFQNIRRPTRADTDPTMIEEEIIASIREILAKNESRPVGVGVGVAGQVDPLQGQVLSAGNLGWKEVPLQKDLSRELGLPVVVLNDVRAATWGEWLYGNGRGCDDFVCLFVGTGVGGGIVSGGRLLNGTSNSAGEIGHIIVDWHGPSCTCGSQGCLEALAGGWAIARRAQMAVSSDPAAGVLLLELSGGQPKSITAEIVSQAARRGDSLSVRLMEEVKEALIAGIASLVNVFNPSRIILGGGVIDGNPELVEWIGQGVRAKALKAATGSLEIVPSMLKGNAGVIGAAAFAMRLFYKKEESRG